MPDLPPLLKAALQLRAETDLSRFFLPAMPDPTPLSPAAQAVMDAANGASSWGPDDCLNDAREIAAAALRAAADQVVPAQLGLMHPVAQAEAEAIRADFLAIAAELEGQQ